MSKCCAYHWSRSPGGIFFGYQRSTNPGSDQLAVPTRIFPATHQRSRRSRQKQTRFEIRESDARARPHSQSFAIQQRDLVRISHEVLWSAMRHRIAFDRLLAMACVERSFARHRQTDRCKIFARGSECDKPPRFEKDW